MASRDGREGSVTVHQDVSLYAGLLGAGQRATVSLAGGRRAWVQVARGSVIINGVLLGEGDGAAVIEESRIEASGPEGSSQGGQVLVFDLA